MTGIDVHKPWKNPGNLRRIGLADKFYTNVKRNQISLSLNKLKQKNEKPFYFLIHRSN